MPETLAGNIAEMSLLEILKMLNSGKMSGRLSITNSFGKGEIYVQSGEIVHCETGVSIGESAYRAMLSWIEGKFRFQVDIDAPQRTIQNSTMLLINEGARTIQDWQNIKKVVSTIHEVFALSLKRNSEPILINASEWQVMAQLNEVHTVEDVIEATKMDEYTVARLIYQLHAKDLVEKRAHPQKVVKEVVNNHFFINIEQELIRVIGPMASIIIDEALEEMEETRDHFPKNEISTLIERVSNEISNDVARAQFSEKMLASIKSY